MSAGLPWVSTPVGGVPAVFGDLSGGHVLDSFDLKDLEEAVRNLKGNDSRADWESNFTVDRAGSQYSELLQKEEEARLAKESPQKKAFDPNWKKATQV